MKYISTLTGTFLLAVIFAVSCSQDTMSGLESSNQSNLAGNPSSNSTDLHMEATYDIKIENLTPATVAGASQPLSPPVIASHSPDFRIFHIGAYASDELRNVAEDAINGPLVSLLQNSDDVYNMTTGSGPILPGSNDSFSLKAKRGYHKISFVSMLVNTNDAFTGMDKVTLPEKGSKTYYLRSYDAGTEKNTELTSDIPGPCCGNVQVRVPTHERIQFHSGILGIGDLDPAIYDWDDPVAKVTITRMN